MSDHRALTVKRSSRTSHVTLVLMIVAVTVLAATPWLFGIGGTSRAVALLVYILLAVMWNALAGYAGLVSIGQTLFFGVSAYTTIRLADAGMDPFLAIIVSTVLGAGLGPGPVETPILKQFRSVLGDERVDSDIDKVGRAGTANDIAPSILYSGIRRFSLDQRNQPCLRWRTRSRYSCRRNEILEGDNHEHFPVDRWPGRGCNE